MISRYSLLFTELPEIGEFTVLHGNDENLQNYQKCENCKKMNPIVIFDWKCRLSTAFGHDEKKFHTAVNFFHLPVVIPLKTVFRG
jgi:hypothetical protein